MRKGIRTTQQRIHLSEINTDLESYLPAVRAAMKRQGISSFVEYWEAAKAFRKKYDHTGYFQKIGKDGFRQLLVGQKNSPFATARAGEYDSYSLTAQFAAAVLRANPEELFGSEETLSFETLAQADCGIDNTFDDAVSDRQLVKVLYDKLLPKISAEQRGLIMWHFELAHEDKTPTMISRQFHIDPAQFGSVLEGAMTRLRSKAFSIEMADFLKAQEGRYLVRGGRPLGYEEICATREAQRAAATVRHEEALKALRDKYPPLAPIESTP